MPPIASLMSMGDGLVIYSAVVTTLSVIVYSLSGWYSRPIGRHLMAYMASIALVLDLGAVRIFSDDANWFLTLRLFAFIILAIMFTLQLGLLIYARYLDVQTDVRQ